jgi:hypothetical protein
MNWGRRRKKSEAFHLLATALWKNVEREGRKEEKYE